MFDRFEALLEQVDRQFRRASSNVSYETKQYANYRLSQITPKIQRVTRANAYQDWLIDKVQEARERFRLYKRFETSQVEDLDEFLEGEYYDAVREQPVCTCNTKHSHKCPLKNGELPVEVRKADDIDEGIRQFQASHDGRPVVLLDARDGFYDFVGDVEHELRDLIAILATDEIPADADWPSGQSSTDAQRAD